MLKKYFLVICFYSSVSAQQLDWISTIHYSAETGPKGVAKDNDNNIYIAGQHSVTYKDNGGGTFLRKYSSSGSLIWEDISYATFDTECAGVVVDSQGNSYIAVYLRGQNSSIKFGNTTYPGGFIMYLLKYSPGGQILWVKNQANYSEPFAICIDKKDFIYASGAWAGGGFITKYDTMGTCIATITTTESYGISSDDQGNIYVQNGYPQYFFQKFDPSGNLLWSYPTIAARMTTDIFGNTYLTSHVSPGASSLTKLDPDGQPIWSGTVPFWADAIYTDINNYLYIAGYDVNNMIVSKYSPSHVEIWSLQLPLCAPSGLCVSGNDLYMSCGSGNPTFSAYLYKINMPASPLSILQNEKPSGLLVSPNPSGAIFSVCYKGDDASLINLRVSDLSGKLIINRAFSNFSGELNENIDLTGFARGIYILELSNAKVKETRKLVVE